MYSYDSIKLLIYSVGVKNTTMKRESAAAKLGFKKDIDSKVQRWPSMKLKQKVLLYCPPTSHVFVRLFWRI